MPHRTLTVVICLASCLGWSLPAAAEATDPPADIGHPGVIRKVTLYRQLASVTREIPFSAGAKLQTLTVPDLPEHVVAGSVTAAGSGKAIVRAVRVSPIHASQSTREEVRALDKQIVEIEQELSDASQMLQVADKDLQRLDQLVSFTAATGKSDLSRGVLKAETLTELATFSMSKHRELAKERYDHEQRINQLKLKRQSLQKRRELVARGPLRGRYQAKVFLETDGAAGSIRLTYLVSECGWSPQYMVRGQTNKQAIQLQYSAVVHQMSGEDWNHVALTLSTASPSVNAAGPTITPLRVASEAPAGAPAPNQVSATDDPFGEPVKTSDSEEPLTSPLPDLLKSLRARQQNAESTYGFDFQSVSQERRDLTLNSLAGQLQQIELQTEWKSWQMLAPDAAGDTARQVYRLKQPVSLAARREQQLVQVLEADLKADLYHVATPLLSSYAYREAQVTNTQPNGLLGGPATVYLDDRFVGRTQLPSTASGQRLTIGLGADPQVRTRRELLNKEDAIQGGNRQLKFSYRLVLASFKDEPVNVRLFDRIPNARQSQQLSVRLEDPKQPLSDDGLYRRVSRPSGILRWDIPLPEGRHGSKAFDVLYNFTMEFDRSQVPTTEHSLAEVQSEFNNMNEIGGGFGGGGFGGGGFGGGGAFGGGGP